MGKTGRTTGGGGARVAAAWVIAVLLVCGLARVGLADEYEAYTPIDDVTITSPDCEEEKTWCAKSEHSLVCTTAYDTDCNKTTGETEDDSVTHYWTASGGSFVDDDNIGTSVDYICPDAGTEVTLTVYADDDYEPDSNTALYDETATSDSVEVTVVKVTLEVEKSTLTLKHDNESKLEVKVEPSSLTPDSCEIKIKRSGEGASWCTLASTCVLDPWTAKIAGNMKLKGIAVVNAVECESDEESVAVQFPSCSQMTGDATVSAAMSTEWSHTLADCTEDPNQRREHGFWIQLNTTSDSYDCSAHRTGPFVGPTQGAWIDPGTRPADDPADPSPCANGATYTVGFFHTHTPMTYRTGLPRPVGPSTPDTNWANAQDVPISGTDYVESPSGSGSIPAGHPEGAATQNFCAGPDRRSTPD